MPSYPVRPKNLKKAGLNEDNVAALRNLTKRVDFLYEGTINNGAGSIVWNPTTGTYQVTRSDGTVYNLIMEEVNDPLDSSGNPNDYSYFPRADSGAVLKNSVLQEKEKSLAMNMVPSSDGTKPSFRISGDSGAGLDLYQNTSRTLAARFSTDITTATTTLRSQQKFRFDIGTSEAMRIDTNLTVTIGTLVVSTDFQTPFADFDVTASVTRETARLWWNNDDNAKTLMIGGEGNQVDIKVGESTYFRVRASSAITKGQVVMITGTVGASGALTAAPATGLTKTESSKIMGIAAEDIALNGWGYIAEFGLLRQIDTSAFSDGDILYYDPSVTGGLTATEPGAPNPKVEIAAVVLGGTSNGSVFLRLNHHFELNELNDINTTGVSNGDLLKYNSTSDIWEDTPQSSVAAGTANTLATARTISLTGDVSGSTSFDGSADVSITATVADDSHNHIIANVDGLQAALDGKEPTITILPVSKGGTGASSLTSGYLLKGNGTSAVSASVIYDDGTNIGVGTALPARSLDVAGFARFNSSGNYMEFTTNVLTSEDASGANIRAAVSSASTPTYSVAGDTNTGAFFPAADTFAFSTGGTERMRLNSTGLGIGTTSPANELHLKGAGGTSARLETGNGSNYTEIKQTQTNPALTFLSDGTESMRIDNATGNVGIGVSSPNRTLSVNSGTTDVVAQFESSDSGAYIALKDSATSSVTAVRIGAIGDDLRFNAADAEGMRLTSTGLGIGTSSPSYKFHINGTGYASGDFRAPIFYDSDNTAFYVNPASNSILSTARVENLGIGTNSGTYGLHVYHTDNFEGGLFQTNQGGSLIRFIDSSTNAIEMGIQSGNPVIRTGNTARLTVDNSSGYVTASQSFRAPIFYDSNNTSYYVDPASTSNVNNITIAGVLTSNATPTRDKLRVWSNGTYTIGMDNAFTYGGLNDYAMTFQMSNTADRGWWWGDTAHTDAQGAMALTTNGRLTVANRIRVGYGERLSRPYLLRQRQHFLLC